MAGKEHAIFDRDEEIEIDLVETSSDGKRKLKQVDVIR